MRAILTYHSIDDSGSALSTAPDIFDRQMRWLARSKIQVVSVDEIMAVPADVDAVALTFDDGLESFATRAWPVIEAAGLPVTLYVVSALTGRHNTWDESSALHVPRQRLLDWDTIGRLHDKGVTIGSHTRSHADLVALDPQRLADEIEGSRRDIRDAIGVTPVSFAYPYGSVGGEAARLVRKSYRTACTCDLRSVTASDERHLLPRLDTYYFRKAGQLEAWGSRAFHWRLRLRACARTLRSRTAWQRRRRAAHELG